jgi:S1-C subfamily serine protease
MSRISSLILIGLLVGANAMAADSPPAANSAAATPSADLEVQLSAARQKLEAAARDVAQLSSQLGQSALAHVQSLRTRAVLGLQLQVEPSSKEQGATIMGVSPGGPAAEAGLAAGDVIVALNGAQITGPDAPRQVVARMVTVKPDSKVTLKVMREGKPKEFQVTPRASVAAFFPPFNGPGRPGGANEPWQGEVRPAGFAGVGALFEGMELADMSPGLGQYFGTTQGVLVIRVPREGGFLKLQDGDVILSIDGRVPENGSHATRILRSYQPGEKIHLKIMRQKKPMELEGTLPDHRRGARGPGPGQPGDRPLEIDPGPELDPGIRGRSFPLPPPPLPPQGHMVPLGTSSSAVQLAALPPK